MQLRDEYPRIRQKGAELVVVGNGQPFHARDFQQEYDLEFPLYVDPDLEAYAAAGLRRGVKSTMSIKSLGHAVRALKSGSRQKKTQGDPWQQGGVFVIHPPDTESFAHVSKEAGDHPTPEAFLAAL